MWEVQKLPRILLASKLDLPIHHIFIDFRKVRIFDRSLRSETPWRWKNPRAWQSCLVTGIFLRHQRGLHSFVSSLRNATAEALWLWQQFSNAFFWAMSKAQGYQSKVFQPFSISPKNFPMKTHRLLSQKKTSTERSLPTVATGSRPSARPDPLGCGHSGGEGCSTSSSSRRLGENRRTFEEESEFLLEFSFGFSRFSMIFYKFMVKSWFCYKTRLWSWFSYGFSRFCLSFSGVSEVFLGVFLLGFAFLVFIFGLSFSGPFGGYCYVFLVFLSKSNPKNMVLFVKVSFSFGLTKGLLENDVLFALRLKFWNFVSFFCLSLSGVFVFNLWEVCFVSLFWCEYFFKFKEWATVQQ